MNLHPRLAAPLLIVCAALSMGATPSPSLPANPTEAVRAAFDGEALPGLDVLGSRGAAVERLASYESLPDGALLTEAVVSLAGKRVRVPVRVEPVAAGADCAPGWRATWAPGPEYTTALFAFVSGDVLAEAGPNAPAWGALERAPSLPIILTTKHAITPFGKVAVPARNPDDLTALQASRDLTEHAQRWLREVTSRDPGLAGIDLLASADVDWQVTQQTLLSLGAQGLFKVYLVGRRADGFAATEASLPIVRFGGDRPHPLILGFYPQGEDVGWRVSYTKSVLPAEEGSCSPEVSFCRATPLALATRLAALASSMREKDPKAAGLVMFAAPGEVTMAQALPWISELTAPLSLTPASLFIGYIKR